MFMNVGSIEVVTTHNKEFTPEELAQRAVNKIIYVGNSSHPAIKGQAEVFKQQIAEVVLFYLKEAIMQDRITLANRLREAGHPELVTLLEN